MANTFNNEVIGILFSLRMFTVLYIMVIKGNRLIVSFIEVGQYEFL